MFCTSKQKNSGAVESPTDVCRALQFVSCKESQRRKHWGSGFRLNAWLFSNAWVTHELSHLQPDVIGYKYIRLLDL